MQVEDARYLKKKVKVGSLDVHPTEKALVVNYELEATILGQLGDAMLGDKKECQKIIRLKSLDNNTDIAALSREVVDKCKLIHPSKLNEVQHLISYLLSRKDTGKDGQVSLDHPTPGLPNDMTEQANLNELDSYMEMLYEDMPEKVRGASLILQLARNPDYLEELCQNETVLGALARVLREDWKKSLDLSYNIVYTFFCFSVFSNFHTVISHFKIGSLCMDIIDGELQRTDQYREQLTKRKKGGDLAIDPIKLQQDYERNLKKYQTVVEKQDQVLRVCTYLLLNIAEDVRVEEKMRRKNIVGLLVRMLERESTDLLLLVVSFLKKLSVYMENKDDMADLNIVEKVSRLVATENSDLLNVTVRLLLNLSFDVGMRAKMIKVGLLPKLVALISEERHQQAVLAVLYHLSVDDKCKSMFTYTDCIPVVMKLVLNSPGSQVPLELMALAVNLAANKRNAQLICEGAGLKLLLKRALKYRDPLLTKMIRNIAQHEGPTRALFTETVGELCEVVSSGKSDEFVLECVGVLGNLSLPDLDYSQLLSKYNLIDWIKESLQPDAVEDDLALEVVVLLGTVAGDQAAAELIVESGILHSLVNLLNAKQEDDEVVLQIVYVFYQLTRHEVTRPQVISTTEVPAYLIDLMHDKNTEIRRVCDTTLDIIAENDEDWAIRIQCHKFRWYNSQWLDMVEEAENIDTMGGEEMAGGEGLGHSYLHHSDVLDHQGLYSDGLSSPESEEYPGINGHSEGSRPSSNYTNRLSLHENLSENTSDITSSSVVRYDQGFLRAQYFEQEIEDLARFSADLEQFADELLKKAGV
ncbi:kinesin-associated protein 3 isoform X2 [Procambarus clarkii]|uniref:kinesin-associated protein 3 isoform X2 n=1 Tax=Procambarus clarkii TaxID=6728 RepID=UPI001E674EC9|nr:kinesin-associated protein 3-like isoform X2 [Procambarus clarkii]